MRNGSSPLISSFLFACRIFEVLIHCSKCWVMRTPGFTRIQDVSEVLFPLFPCSPSLFPTFTGIMYYAIPVPAPVDTWVFSCLAIIHWCIFCSHPTTFPHLFFRFTGSSTASLLCIEKEKGVLHTLNLGDSGFLLIRDGKVFCGEDRGN